MSAHVSPHVRQALDMVGLTPAALPRLRATMESMIEEMITILDGLDAAGEDLEDGHDAEADGSDDEPSLGAPENHAAGPDQAHWAQGNRSTILDAEIDAADLGVTGYDGRDIHDQRADQAIARGLERQAEAIRARTMGRCTVPPQVGLRLVHG